MVTWTPERAAEWQREYNRRPEVQERIRAYRQTPEYLRRSREWNARYRARPEAQEATRAYRRTPEYRERSRVRAARNRARPEVQERIRGYVRTPERRQRQRERNLGLGGVKAFESFWAAQGGRCYLCGDKLTRETAVIDHDHTCCPPRRSCDRCRRGIACPRCNRLIGQVGDDTSLLRLIADNLDGQLAKLEDR